MCCSSGLFSCLYIETFVILFIFSNLLLSVGICYLETFIMITFINVFACLETHSIKMVLGLLKLSSIESRHIWFICMEDSEKSKKKITYYLFSLIISWKFLRYLIQHVSETLPHGANFTKE